MKHKAWSSRQDVPYCFSRSSVKFWGHRGQEITNFDPNWAFPDCNFSLNSPMALKWCTKLDIVLFLRSSIKFPGHMGPKNNDLNPILSKNTRPVTAIKSLRFALFRCSLHFTSWCVPVIHFLIPDCILQVDLSSCPFASANFGQQFMTFQVTCHTERMRDDFNPQRAGTELSLFNYVNVIAADVLAPCVARTPAAMIMTM